MLQLAGSKNVKLEQHLYLISTWSGVGVRGDFKSFFSSADLGHRTYRFQSGVVQARA